MSDRATYSEIRRAMRRFHWEDSLQNFGLDVTLRDVEVGGECPWCHWKRQSFYLNVDKGVFKCHYCGRTGWAIDVIAEVLRCSTQDAINRVLEQRVSVYDNDPYETEEVELADEEEPPPAIAIPPEFYPLADNTSMTSRPYRKYALTRMTEEQMERYGVGYVHGDCKCPPEPNRDGILRPPHNRYRGRIIVPVMYTGRLVSFVARAIVEDSYLKVDTPPGNEQYSYLFNLERVWGQKRVVITEGVFDAMALDKHSVATFGKKVTDAQTVLLLNAGVRELVIAWDADAQKEIWEAYLRLSFRFDKVTAIELPKGEDPSSLGHDDMVELLQTAEPPPQPTIVGGDVLDKGYERLKI